jgi:aspartate/methionine/tyrosine aminotransferase
MEFVNRQITTMNFARRTNWELRPNRFAEALSAHRAAGKELLDLTASNPPEAGLKYDADAILAAFRNSKSMEYHPEPKGLLCAREAVVEYYADVAKRAGAGCARDSRRVAGGTKADAERIVLTTSTSEAYTYAFRLLCDPGDEVLIPTPSYPLFEYLAGLQDVRLVPYPLFYDHGWHVDFYSLRQAIGPRTRAIILVNPNNPTGSYVSESETEELNAICHGHNLALIVDEVFLDYSLGDARPSFAFNDAALTFTLSGVSKISGLPQMKLAWMVISGPDELAGAALARVEVIADTYLSMNAPVQLAASALLDQRHSIREQLMSRVRANLSELDSQLAGGAVSRLQVEGGWYAVLRVPRVQSDEDMAIALLENTNVLVQPGYFYDFPNDGYIVVSLITPEQTFREGMTRFVSCNL